MMKFSSLAALGCLMSNCRTYLKTISQSPHTALKAWICFPSGLCKGSVSCPWKKRLSCDWGNSNLYSDNQSQKGDASQLKAMSYTPLTVILLPGRNCVVVYHAPYQMHYNDVIMGAMASQITSLTIVYSTIYSGADRRKHQSSASGAFVRGIHRSPVNSPHQ